MLNVTGWVLCALVGVLAGAITREPLTGLGWAAGTALFLMIMIIITR